MNPKQQESHLGLVLAMSLGGAVLGALIMAVAFSSSLALKYKFIIILGALLLVALLVVAILWWRRYRQDGRSFKFRERLKGMLGSIGSGRSAEEQAAVEQMRRKFEALIPKLREAGRDIYEMPWFLIIGPSGSGKSWVLRAIKSLVPLVDTDPEGRPSGASATAGKGGTLMMDWWTCPDAIVLDTAGGVVFPEEKAYESPEWELLLDLLRKYRPECPINGLLVVIPAEMLLLEAKDLVEKGATTLEEYAESLRGQIRDRLQRGLQIRFPVYFLITKSDRIPGFREFSDEIESVTNAPKLKDQIVGWSNAAPVGGGGGGGGGLRAAQADSPLRKGPRRPGLGGAGSLALLPESAEAEGFDRTAVEAYLRQVAEDLRRRRTTILDRYAGAAAGGMDTRRMAATLFSFPSALERMAPRLQAFLEVVFQPELQRKPDEVDKMPPFVRGIYITSAMREGEVLDPLRARRKGVSLARLALPGGPERNVKKAFFLNDLFSQKILFESGLVMPLVAARQYLISRRRKLVWTGIVASLALLTVFSVGAWNYYVSVGKKLKIWAEMGRLASTNALYWRPVVTNSAPGGYALDDAALKEHLVLANSAAEGLKSSRLGQLYDLPGGIEAQLPTAQCLVFERGVVRPLADFAKAKLSSPMTAPPSADIPGLTRRYEDGLLAWIELGCIPEVRSWPEAVLAKSGDRVIGGGAQLAALGREARSP